MVRRWSAKPIEVGSIPTLESKQTSQCHLMVRYSPHKRGYAGFSFGDANADDPRRCYQISGCGVAWSALLFWEQAVVGTALQKQATNPTARTLPL
jgi:hypothetical protein